GRSRDSAQILGEQKRSSERNRAGVIDALHVIKNTAIALRNDLLRGEIDSLGEHLHASWIAKRQLASGITDPWIDQWYQVAREAGALGGKIAGAGGWRPGIGINGGHDTDWLVLLMLPVMGLLFLAQGLYEPANLMVGAREFGGVFRACAYGLLAVTIVTFVLRWPLSRAWTVLS